MTHLSRGFKRRPRLQANKPHPSHATADKSLT
jgi:hypothetical protein